jgi:hypothetical protein
VERAPDGAVRLGPLRPGAYRVRYTLSRAHGGAALEPAESAAQVVAGREVTLH